MTMVRNAGQGAMSDQPILRIEAVEKRFGAVRAVDGVSLEIGQGEFFALLGPSGSGKTTLLRIVSGLETPDRGRVEIGGTGRDGAAALSAPHRHGVSGFPFCFRTGRLRRTSRFPSRCRAGVRPSGRNSSPGSSVLSTWKASASASPISFRVARSNASPLARGLIARPELLLLDEPLANLDRELRKEMEIEVRRYQEELGIPFVYVTHNQEEALTMSDRMAVMHQGGLEQIGPKLDVYNAPATRFVASFVGAPNKLSGRVIDGDGERLRIDWGGITLTGRCVSDARPDDPVEVFLKSERIVLSPAADGIQHENRFEGTVRDIIFKGQFADYIVRADNEVELVVSGPPTIAGVDRNSRVSLGWDVEAADVFTVEDGEP